MRRAWLLLFIGACGPAVTAPPPRPPPQPAPPSIDDLAWMRGDWLAEDERSTEHWTAGDSTLCGVHLSDDAFELMAIDAAVGSDGTPALRFLPAPGGVASDPFTGVPDAEAHAITFRNPAHDDPTSIRYAHESGAGAGPERLVATLDGPGGVRRFAFNAVIDAPEAPREVLDAALGRAPPRPPAPGMWAPRPMWSRRSLPEGNLAVTLDDRDRTNAELVIWTRDAAGHWGRTTSGRCR